MNYVDANGTILVPTPEDGIFIKSESLSDERLESLMRASMLISSRETIRVLFEEEFFKNVDIDPTPYFKYGSDMMRFIRRAKIQRVDIDPYLDKGFDMAQLKVIVDALSQGYEVNEFIVSSIPAVKIEALLSLDREGYKLKKYYGPEYGINQIYEIVAGLRLGLDVTLYDNSNFTYYEMFELRQAMMDGLDVRLIADPNKKSSTIKKEINLLRKMKELKERYTDEQLLVMFDGISNGLNVVNNVTSEMSAAEMKIVTDAMKILKKYKITMGGLKMLNNVDLLWNLTTYSKMVENDRDRTVINLADWLMRTYGTDILYRSSYIHLTVASMVFNAAHDKVLMIRHNLFDTWCIPGGHSDGDTDLFSVSLKELEEETGLNHDDAHPLKDGAVCALDLYVIDGHIRKGENVDPHIHLNFTYVFEASDDVSLRIKPDENSGAMWVPICDMEKYCRKGDFIDTYRKCVDIVEGVEK